jgi:dolichol-phosphate mannosyltransferase
MGTKLTRKYKMFLSIIIPVKDEPAIQELIDEINKTVKQNHEIIIVDKSKVQPSIKGAKVICQRSDGLGNAFIEGLGHAKGNLIALMDGDGSHRPEDLINMLSEIEKYELVLGSKLIKGGHNDDSLGRRMVTLAFAWFTRLILWVDIKDPMTGFMVAKRDIFNKVELKPRGFKIVVELVYKSRAKVIEVPISFREREAGFSKAGFNMRGIKEISKIIMLLLELKLGRVAGKW